MSYRRSLADDEFAGMDDIGIDDFDIDDFSEDGVLGDEDDLPGDFMGDMMNCRTLGISLISARK